MNILDHSGHSRGFPWKLSVSASVGYYYLNSQCCIVDQLWGKRLGLQHLRIDLVNCAFVRSDYTCSYQGLLRSELLIALVLEGCQYCWPSVRHLFFGVQLKGDLSRAPVDWKRASSFFNDVIFTLRCSSRSSSSSWCLVSRSFICISSSSLLRSNRACSSRILVSNSTSNFFILSSRLCFACCCSILHCLSNWVVRWVVVIALVVVHCLSCVLLLCIHCWLHAFAYIFKPMIVQTCFALSCFFQMFFKEISLIGHKLVLTLQLLGYSFL